MTILLATDLHFGARKDSEHVLNNYEEFFENVLFPTIDEHKIDTIIDCGDVFDRRLVTNTNTLHRAREMYFDKLRDRNIAYHHIIGNHDTYFKNTNRVNSPCLHLKSYDNVKIYEKPEYVTIKDQNFLFVPWITSENYDSSLGHIRENIARYCFGHLEINGFEYQKGKVCEHGLSVTDFEFYDLTASGHFHGASRKGNITYLGNPFWVTWSDYPYKKGIYLFDEVNNRLELIENPYNLFIKLEYDNGITFDPEDVKNKYVKLEVINGDNATDIEKLIAKLEEQNIDVTVDYEKKFEVLLEEEKENEVQGTLQMIEYYVETMPEEECDKENIRKELLDIYKEAETNY